MTVSNRSSNRNPPPNSVSNRSSPLFLHQNGQWAKKIAGRHRYFGTDRDAANAAYRATLDSPVARICDAYLAARRRDVDAGEIAPRTLEAYQDTVAILERHLDGFKPSDFVALYQTIRNRFGEHRTRNHVTRTKTILTWAWNHELLSEPPRYGDFGARRVRRRRQIRYTYTGDQVRGLASRASPQLAAMIWLGISCGFGPGDCAGLLWRHIEGDRIEYPRPKTGVSRRCVLWPEISLTEQPEPPDRPVFLTKYGNPWVRSRIDRRGRVRHDNAVSKAFAKLDPPAPFYALRHTFRTIADEVSGDQHAIATIMGHRLPGMADVYVSRVSWDRVRAVSDAVRVTLHPRRP